MNRPTTPRSVLLTLTGSQTEKADVGSNEMKMRSGIIIVMLIAMCLMSGCAYYGLTATNCTGEQIGNAKVEYANGNGFEWGVMDPDVSKGAQCMDGPYKGNAIVSWVMRGTGDRKAFTVDAALSRFKNDVTFLLYTNRVEVKLSNREY